MPANLASGGPGLENQVPSERGIGQGALDDEIKNWLDQVGLGDTSPFWPWDAGEDPDLSNYLVQHDVFRTIWQDSPAVVFAPAGGGKSAFRVRLTHACRVEEDDRQVFAIPYIAPKATATSLDDHLQALLWYAAHELLLRLLYRPERLATLDRAGQEAVRRALDHNAPGLLAHFWPQIERAGSLAPLAETFDPSAARLPAPAGADRVHALGAELLALPEGGTPPPAGQRFEVLRNLLLGPLRFEAIYLLVDGVDAFFETMEEPRQALSLLQPLLDRQEAWAGRQVFLKLFLPIDLYKIMPILTEPTKVAIISWKSESLSSVLRARLRSGSRGRFDSLDAISDPSLRDAESALIRAVTPVPRELLVLANRVIVEHVWRAGANGRLEAQDVEAAIAWYRRTQPRVSSP